MGNIKKVIRNFIHYFQYTISYSKFQSYRPIVIPLIELVNSSDVVTYKKDELSLMNDYYNFCLTY